MISGKVSKFVGMFRPPETPRILCTEKAKAGTGKASVAPKNTTFARCRVDADGPEIAELALFGAAVPECVDAGVQKRFFGRALF